MLWSTETSDSLWYNTTTDFNTFSPEARGTVLQISEFDIYLNTQKVTDDGK